MSALAERLRRACAELGLRAELGFKLTLPNGREVDIDVRLADLGGPNGMLVLRSYDDIEEYAQAIIDMGYGFSVMSDFGRDEGFDIESFREIFADWGWGGAEEDKPAWMDEYAPDDDE